MEAVKYLIEEAGVPAAVSDRWHDTPLHDAEKHGHQAIATYLRAHMRRTGDGSSVPAHSRTKTPIELKYVALAVLSAAAAAANVPALFHEGGGRRHAAAHDEWSSSRKRRRVVALG